MEKPPANPQAGRESEVVVGDVLSKHDAAEPQSRLWIGAIPPPDAFSAYPQAAQDFILKSAKDEGSHRRGIETKALDANIAHGKRGQNYSFIAVMASLLVSGGLVYSGRDWGAIIMLGILPAVAPQIENLLKALKALFGGGKKDGDNKQHNSNEHSN